jgi:hypothetical protein
MKEKEERESAQGLALRQAAPLVAQTAKSARSQENAASSGRFGNLRYAGSRNIN